MRITQVKPQRHRLTAVWLDGEKQVVDTETFLLSGLGEGSEVSQSRWQELTQQATYNRAYEKALYLLDYRAHSRGELFQKISREYSQEATLQALERVEALGLIDDYDFATRLAQELTQQKGYGKARVQADLLRREIDRELIQQVLLELPLSQVEVCKAWLLKKYKTLPTDRAQQQKVLASGVRRGFDYATLREAWNQCVAWEEELWQYE